MTSSPDQRDLAFYKAERKRKREILPVVYLVFGTRRGKIGEMKFELFEDKVPTTCANFMELCKTKYRGCNMHRIIPGFMAQGGDFERGDGRGGYSVFGQTFADENLDGKHDREGLLSMANSGPDTNGSQFFITFDFAPHLDGKHVVFGKMLDDDETVDTLRKLEDYGSMDGKPTETIKIIDCGIEV